MFLVTLSRRWGQYNCSHFTDKKTEPEGFKGSVQIDNTGNWRARAELNLKDPSLVLWFYEACVFLSCVSDSAYHSLGLGIDSKLILSKLIEFTSLDITKCVQVKYAWWPGLLARL